MLGLMLISFQGSLATPSSTLLPQIDVSLTVNWEMTRSGFRRSRVASESETYAESWRFIQQSYGRTYLESPRARVPVQGFKRIDPLSRVPEVIVISKKDLAHLLGLNINDSGANPVDVVFINLRSSAEQANTFSLQPNREKRITVSLSFHN